MTKLSIPYWQLHTKRVASNPTYFEADTQRGGCWSCRTTAFGSRIPAARGYPFL